MITIKLSDLKNKIEEMEKDNHEYVEISILEEDKTLMPDEYIPASVHFEAYDGYGGGIDYEYIEDVEIDPFYKENNWQKL